MEIEELNASNERQGEIQKHRFKTNIALTVELRRVETFKGIRYLAKINFLDQFEKTVELQENEVRILLAYDCVFSKL